MPLRKGSDIEFALGFSHTITVKPPQGIEFEVPSPTLVVVRGIDKQAVGQVAAKIRGLQAAGALQGQGHPLRGRVRVIRKVGKRA